jgi:predicted metal-dependent phosphoesterase TrpH
MFDLHIHTTATPHHSTWEPEVLVQAACAQGLTTIAATDHNTTASVAALQAVGQRAGLRVIAGVEIDSAFQGKLWHTLVYGVDPTFAPLLELCESVLQRNLADAVALQQTLRQRGFRLVGLDLLGRPANVADVGSALATYNELPGRIASDDDEAAGMRYILTEVPDGYAPPSVAEVIAIAHQGGGLAILAHPGRSKGVYAIPADEADLQAMKKAGLDGIEVFYPTHSPAQREMYALLAEQLALLVTGGSDSHHPHQPLANWPEERAAAFLRRIG